ncbi:elongation factor P 5-aminopentanone reductase [Lentibacillus sp. CBA3610]|uniref:elongation factor P 5-aminopentanone reductase n=1 Tax=Lentibacillus sp. CBA3610 TaxID=2518176 RepID=UPI001595F228|nr:SDR family oxidoreductase [Lentibacillus sp. CBA3610]QKY69082.1 SDR family oxidoreductase [Lentibacillus sp. CBA3610]
MGRNVLIIGASGDIGTAIAKQLAEEGYQLILHYYQNKQAMEDNWANLEAESILMDIQADLSNTKGISHLISQAVFPVDAIIFAGGNAHYGLFQDMNETLMDRMLTLHVKAPWMITKHLLPSMIQHKQGRIIFITSVWGEVGAGNEVVYSSVKGAQNSFVKALSKETAPSGVAVNAVSPGFIDTKMNQQLLREEKEKIIHDIPANRAGTSDDIAHTVSFLMSKQSDYIHGEIIHVSGGWRS